MNDDFRQNLLPPFVAFVRRQLDRPLNLADLQWLYNPFCQAKVEMSPSLTK
jgi:hypothetical protein